MSIKRAGVAVLMAVVATLSTAPATGASTDNPQVDDIKLTGCLVRGEEGGYLLTNGPSEPAWQKADASITPGAVGTAGTVATVFYWLRDDNALRDHVGHRVELEGELENEIADGDIKVDRKDQWTEIEIKAKGDTLKARIPNTSVVPVGDGDHKAQLLVRKVDVEKVRMTSANCQP